MDASLTWKVSAGTGCLCERVAASALDRDGELVGCGHHGTGPESKEPDRDARHVVHAIDLLDAEALHEAVLDHRVTTPAALLGRLEDQHRRAVEVARLSEVLSGPEQHGGVAVMTTGMHPAGDFGLVRHVCGFCDR